MIIPDVPKTDLIRMVEHILFAPALIQHIQGGAARDLYPQHVSDAVTKIVHDRAVTLSQGGK